ncbi:MAG: hypothetical protein NVSMB64_21120 [Candidatus Velthaea sp.]
MLLVSPGGDGRAVLLLATVMLVASALYAAALVRPPPGRLILAAAAAALSGAMLVPALFSADAFAYAYYGDLLLHGHNPYAHDPGLLRDPLARAAVAAWGHIPPRCVYGPIAVGLAALADALGSPWGVAGAIAAQRVAAGLGFGICLVLFSRLVRERRALVAFAWNPVVIWSVAEGHNDAAMLAFVLAAFAWPRYAALALALGTWVKAPALLAYAVIRRNAAAAGSLALVAAGYVPLAIALRVPDSHVAGLPTDWESPMGLLAILAGRPAALAVGVLVVATAAGLTRGMALRARAAAIAFVVWNVLPNAYPWYALWIVPIAACDVRSPWSRALIFAGLLATVRAATDAMFPNGGALHGEMIAIQYLPPLVLRAAAALRRPAILTGFAALALVAAPLGGSAQTTPAPTALPGPVQVAPVPPPTPAAATTPPPSPGAAASATPNPYGYVVTPPPATAPPGDGPQILEVALNDRTVHAGGALLARVRTSSNVVGVEARALGRFIAVPQSGPGTFAVQYMLPGGIPFWLLNRNYDVVIAAATADGRQTTLTVPLTLAR